MSIVEPGGAPAASSSSIVARAQGLIFRPTEEWKKIEPEAASVQGLYLGWLLPLAAIPAIAGIIGTTVFGVGVPGFLVVKVPLLDAIVRAIVQVALLCGMTWVMALVIDALAPNFGGQKNQMQAFKVAAYSGVAALLAGVFQILPALGILGLVGLYSIYILHRGLPVLMKAAPDKATGYTVSVVLIMLVLWIVAAVILGALMPMNRGGLFSGIGGARVESPASSDGGSITVNGTTVDIGALEKAAKQMEQAATKAENGEVVLNANPVDMEKIKALLPETVAGLPRTEISTGGAAGMGGANAVYQAGDRRIEISVADLGGMGALGSMAGAFGAQSTRETADGYERMRMVDGRMTTEKWSKADKTAGYGVLVANRFMLDVEGSNVSPDEVKAAANAIGVARLEALAK